MGFRLFVEGLGKNFAIHRYRGAPARVISVKVRYWMILLIPVHVDRPARGRKGSGMPRTALKRMPRPILAAPDLDGTIYERAAQALSIYEFDARSRHAQ